MSSVALTGGCSAAGGERLPGISLLNSGRPAYFSVMRNPRLRDLVKPLLGGIGIGRAMQNEMLRGRLLSGRVVDLGAKSQDALHYRFLDRQNADITFCDLHPRTPEIVQVDLEKPLPFADGEFDRVLLFHVLEHVYDTDLLLSEMRRICRGEVLIAVPFAAQYHADPNDYFRFTHQALERKMEDAGFSEIAVHPIGRGPLILALSAIERLMPRTVRLTLLALVWAMDSFCTAVWPRYRRMPGALGYIVVAN